MYTESQLQITGALHLATPIIHVLHIEAVDATQGTIKGSNNCDKLRQSMCMYRFPHC